jgi:hypothetical protein
MINLFAQEGKGAAPGGRNTSGRSDAVAPRTGPEPQSYGCYFDLPCRRPYNLHVDVTIHIPDDLARCIDQPENLPRRALEALALDEFRLGHISHAKLRRILGFGTRYALDGFLKAHGVYSDYTLEDLEQERRDLKRLGF